jgi:hypothetical protein
MSLLLRPLRMREPLTRALSLRLCQIMPALLR